MDISFHVSCDANDIGLLTIRATDTVNNRLVPMRSWTLDGVARHSLFGLPSEDGVRTLVTQLNGSHSILWDSSADYNDIGSTRLSYEISIQRVKQNALDAIGTPNGIIGDAITLDLTALMSTGATSQSIALYHSVDLGTFNCNTYKMTKMALVRVRAGTYRVGATSSTSTSPTLSHVSLTKDYYIGMHTLTRNQYLTVQGTDPSNASISEGLMAPVQKVSWLTMTNGFFAKINAKIQSAGGGLQIYFPTEVQHEIATRAGTTTKWHFGDTSDQLGDYAWYKDNSENIMHTVGTKRANPWGLYDMIGNSWEFCADFSGVPYPCSSVDPIRNIPSNGVNNHTARGGTYKSLPEKVNSQFRSELGATDSSELVCYRVVLNPLL